MQGGLTLKVISPPAVEPVTVAEAKRHMRVDWDDDDEYIADLITSARQWAELKLGRALITQTLLCVMHLPHITEGPLTGQIGHSGFPVELPHPPLVSASLVEIETQIATWASLVNIDDYLIDTDVEPGQLWLAWSAFAKWSPALNYPGTKPRLRITYQAGYGATRDTVPAAIRSCVRKAVAFLYENREEQPLPDSLLPGEMLVMRL